VPHNEVVRYIGQLGHHGGNIGAGIQSLVANNLAVFVNQIRRIFGHDQPPVELTILDTTKRREQRIRMTFTQLAAVRSAAPQHDPSPQHLTQGDKAYGDEPDGDEDGGTVNVRHSIPITRRVRYRAAALARLIFRPSIDALLMMEAGGRRI
jgi:hypothetical protein